MNRTPSTISEPAATVVAPAVPSAISSAPTPNTRLPYPAAARPLSIRWDYAAPIVVMHLLALLVLWPWLFSWEGVGVMVVTTFLFGQLGVPIGYHRLLTHRSFRVAKWLERSLVTIALCSAQDTPARWISWHRMHHQHADEEEDPHSPFVAFLWSHIGWLIFDNRATHTKAVYYKYARDILNDPFYMYLEKHRWTAGLIYLAQAFLFLVAGFVLGLVRDGSWQAGVQLGLSVVVWGVILRTVYVWHFTWSVNSLSHLFGYRNHQTGDGSRNNWLVAMITGGEGWHNNHHHDPTSATVQHRWWELDVNYYIIKLLELVGLASDVVPRRDRRRIAD